MAFHLRFVLLPVLLLSSSTGLVHSAFSRALQNSNTQYQNGIDLYDKGDFREAVKVFKEALKQDKNNVMLWHYLGLACLNTISIFTERRARFSFME
jgi:Flp pilus assembly protein TadD